MKKLSLVFLGLFISLGQVQAAQLVRCLKLSSILYPDHLSKQYKSSIEYVEEKTKACLSDQQIHHITEHLNRNGARRQGSEENERVRRQYTARRSRLIAHWKEKYHFLSGPQGILNTQKEINWHHLIYISYGGINEWWNLWPVERNIHLKDIHGAKSPITFFYQKLDEFHRHLDKES